MLYNEVARLGSVKTNPVRGKKQKSKAWISTQWILAVPGHAGVRNFCCPTQQRQQQRRVGPGVCVARSSGVPCRSYVACVRGVQPATHAQPSYRPHHT